MKDHVVLVFNVLNDDPDKAKIEKEYQDCLKKEAYFLFSSNKFKIMKDDSQTLEATHDNQQTKCSVKKQLSEINFRKYGSYNSRMTKKFGVNLQRIKIVYTDINAEKSKSSTSTTNSKAEPERSEKKTEKQTQVIKFTNTKKESTSKPTGAIPKNNTAKKTEVSSSTADHQAKKDLGKRRNLEDENPETKQKDKKRKTPETEPVNLFISHPLNQEMYNFMKIIGEIIPGIQRMTLNYVDGGAEQHHRITFISPQAAAAFRIKLKDCNFKNLGTFRLQDFNIKNQAETKWDKTVKLVNNL